MSRKHFRAIADALAATKPSVDDLYDGKALAVWMETVGKIADSLRQFNDYFDREKFMVACGMPDIEGGG